VSETEVSTISDLDNQGRIVWTEIKNWHAPRSAAGTRTAYWAYVKGTESGWEVGKLAFLSRTKQPIDLSK
jgi:hypothetical protein